MKKVIPIFFAVNECYVPYLSVAIVSLIDNASDKYNYNIHIIHENIKESSKKKLKALETDNVKIMLTEMHNSLESITNRIENQLRADHFTLTIYYRIFLPFMFKEYDKAIYIDADTCVTGDISELYNIDLKDNLFAGCNDISCQYSDILCNYFANHAGLTIDKYINSGVLLMNMKKLREINFESKFLKILNEYHFDTVCPDQDYINAMAKGKILYLPNEWDAMPTGGNLVFDNPKICHYNLFLKPWHYDKIDYEDYFWNYVELSPFKKEIIKEKAEFNESNRKEDDKGMEILLSRADAIAKSDLTFKKVFGDKDILMEVE